VRCWEFGKKWEEGGVEAGFPVNERPVDVKGEELVFLGIKHFYFTVGRSMMKLCVRRNSEL
jgi:hypothetical protein